MPNLSQLFKFSNKVYQVFIFQYLQGLNFFSSLSQLSLVPVYKIKNRRKLGDSIAIYAIPLLFIQFYIF